MATGVNTSIIIDIIKKRIAWQKKGKAHCQRCKYLLFGYYYGKKKRTAYHVDKPKHCKDYLKKVKRAELAGSNPHEIITHTKQR